MLKYVKKQSLKIFKKLFSTLQNENKDSLQKLITDVKNSLNDEIVSTYITYLLTLEYIKISMYNKHWLFFRINE